MLFGRSHLLSKQLRASVYAESFLLIVCPAISGMAPQAAAPKAVPKGKAKAKAAVGVGARPRRGVVRRLSHHNAIYRSARQGMRPRLVPDVLSQLRKRNRFLANNVWHRGKADQVAGYLFTHCDFDQQMVHVANMWYGLSASRNLEVFALFWEMMQACQNATELGVGRGPPWCVGCDAPW